MQSDNKSACIWGIASVLLFVISQATGLAVHRGGYGTGPEGIGSMLIGALFGLSGWFISPILGIVSLVKRESPKIYAIIALTGPAVMLTMIVTNIIKI